MAPRTSRSRSFRYSTDCHRRKGSVAIRYARADSALARAGTALTDVLTALADALTARRVGSSLTDAQRCQRAPYEGCSHQPKRPTARDAADSQGSSQLVEGAVGSLLTHLLPPFPEGRDTRACYELH